MRDHVRGGSAFRRFRRFMLVALAVAPSAFLFGQQAPPSHVLQEGEELVYNVRYSFINLGSVRIRTLHRDAEPGVVAYECKALIDSYPKVPFVDLHATYESRIDTTIYSRGFV